MYEPSDAFSNASGLNFSSGHPWKQGCEQEIIPDSRNDSFSAKSASRDGRNVAILSWHCQSEVMHLGCDILLANLDQCAGARSFE